MNEKRTQTILRKPDWLKIKVPSGKEYLSVREIVEEHKLHTICTSGHCPNMHECWGRGTATLMILGDICTRACGFCNVKTGRPLPADWHEPKRVAESVKLMKLKLQNPTQTFVQFVQVNQVQNQTYQTLKQLIK